MFYLFGFMHIIINQVCKVESTWRVIGWGLNGTVCLKFSRGSRVYCACYRLGSLTWKGKKRVLKLSLLCLADLGCCMQCSGWLAGPYWKSQSGRVSNKRVIWSFNKKNVREITITRPKKDLIQPLWINKSHRIFENQGALANVTACLLLSRDSRILNRGSCGKKITVNWIFPEILTWNRIK